VSSETYAQAVKGDLQPNEVTSIDEIYSVQRAREARRVAPIKLHRKAA